MGLSKKELETEIAAVENMVAIHKAQVKLNEHGVKANTYIRDLLKRELETFK